MMEQYALQQPCATYNRDWEVAGSSPNPLNYSQLNVPSKESSYPIKVQTSPHKIGNYWYEYSRNNLLNYHKNYFSLMAH